MRRFSAITMAGVGLVLLITAHGLAAWSGITLTAKIGGWLPWIGGGALAFGLYHVIHHIRGKGLRHSHRSAGHASDGGESERGMHDGFLVNLGHGFIEVTICETDIPPRFRLFFYDKHKQARSVPRNATVTIETARSGATRQTFDFHAKDGYLESTTEIPEPHEFKAVVHVSHGSHTHTHEVHFLPQDMPIMFSPGIWDAPDEE